MTPTLRTYSRRSLFKHPWLSALSVLGIALGVAVVVSIDLANASARRAFELSSEAVAGRATHAIVGGPQGVADDVYRRVRVEVGYPRAAPVVEGYVQLASLPGRTLQLLGVDIFAEAPFRPYLSSGGSSSALDFKTLLARPNSVVLSAATARALGIGVGGSFRARVEGVDRTLVLAGALELSDRNQADAADNLMLTDIATAQELLGKVGRLNRIDLIVDEGDQVALDRLRAVLPPGAELARAASRSLAVEQLTRAFSLNLSALSLLALLVGMFLIYNTTTFSVVRRRPVLGALRALGVTRGEIFSLVLQEALWVATAGTALGLLGGIGLGQGLVHLVTRTINDLYFVVNVRSLEVDPLTLLKGAGLGLGTSVIAALFPALEATRSPPTLVLQRSSLETSARKMVPRLALIGLGVGVGGAALIALPSRSLLLAFGGLFALLVAFALVTPLATWGLALAARPLMSGAMGLLGRMAARGIVASLSRTAVAVAALSISVATTVSVAIMVSSFRETVAEWLDSSLIADIYISAPSSVFRSGDGTLEPHVLKRLRHAPGVAETISVRVTHVRWGDRSVDLIVADYGQKRQRPYRFREGDPAGVWDALLNTDAVMVSEPFAFHNDVHRGSTLRLQTDHGPRDFAVAGVYADYASDVGAVSMARPAYERHFDDRARSGLGVFAAPGADVNALIDQLRLAAGSDQQLIIRPTRALRETSMEVFDRTFTITQVLRLLTVAVSFIGVLSALMALALERARELALLRAIGLLPRQVWLLVSAQTGLMGLFAGLLALPWGLLMAVVLIRVINKRSFGWTLQIQIAPLTLLQGLGLAVVAAVLAGLYPSWRMARENPATVLRES